jgi:CBS domain-containing protein
MERPAVPTAREIMAGSLVTLRPDMMAVEAAELLLKHQISGAPVVDAEGHLLGLLSEFDLLRAVASSDYEMDAHDAIVKVDQLMSRDCHTVSPDMDLFALAHEFVSLRVRRFPVIENGRLIGQVSRRDALRAAVAIRREMLSTKPHYPDYPKGRKPIRDYPA